MLLRIKITLLAVFVLFTLLGLAAPSLEALVIGLGALGLALAMSIGNFMATEHRPERELHSSF